MLQDHELEKIGEKYSQIQFSDNLIQRHAGLIFSLFFCFPEIFEIFIVAQSFFKR